MDYYDALHKANDALRRETARLTALNDARDNGLKATGHHDIKNKG